MSDLLDAALDYAVKGYRVFPCHTPAGGQCSCGKPACDSPGKHPRIKGWQEAATTDAATIKAWWAQWPDANIGVATGDASGVFVLDVDGQEGRDSLFELERQHGEWPETPRQQTGKGEQLWFKMPARPMKNRVRFAPGLDTRSTGGLVIAPPSLHYSGRQYVWDVIYNLDDTPLADPPDWLLDFIQKNSKQAPAPDASQAIPEGQRNDTLYRLGCSMRAKGLGESAILAALIETNAEQCQPPLSNDDVHMIARQAAKHQPGKSPATGRGTEEYGESGAKEEWPEPQSLPAELPPVAPFDPDLLPDVFRPWVTDIAERMQCPVDFPAVAAMICLGAVVGRQVGIRPKRHDDWLVIPNLWGAIVAKPGLLKSPALAEPLKQIQRLEAQARDQYDEEVDKYEADLMVYTESVKLSKKAIAKALKSGDDPHSIAGRAIDNKPREPVRRRYLTNDPTVEKLGELLGQNPRGILVFRDELIGLLHSLDKEGHENSRGFYLEAWNGTGSYTYDRIGRGTIDIPAACVSLLGGIQPGPLAHYVAGALRQGIDDDGLLQRFQLLVWPDVPKEWRNIDRWPDTEARQAVNELLSSLDNLEFLKVGAVKDDPDDLPFLQFSDDAQWEFDTWREKIETRLRTGDEHPAFEGYLAKFRSLIPSIALLCHLADGGVGPVSLESILRACAWGEYLESHARRVYAHALNYPLVAARELDRHLLAGDLPDEFTARDVYFKGWRLLDKDGAQTALEYLEALDRVRSEKRETGGRPRVVWCINPYLKNSEKARSGYPQNPQKGVEVGF